MTTSPPKPSPQPSTHPSACGTTPARSLPRITPNVARARIPDGATLIDNPISAAPGFSLRNVHVMAGVPTIFEAMVASVLPGLTGGAPLLSQSMTLSQGEGDIAAPLGALATEMPDVSFGSYPYLRDGRHGVNVVARSHDPSRLDAAMARLATLFGTP